MSDPVYLDVVFAVPADGPFTYSCSEPYTLGRRVTAPFGRRSLTGFVVEIHDSQPKVPFEIKSVTRLVDAEPIYGHDEIELAGWISRMYLCSVGEALSCILPGGRRDSSMPAVPETDIVAHEPRSLSGRQRNALDGILGGEPAVSYLYGITGSGKTEVFLQAAERILAEDGGVIYLVPEIALTYQLVEDVKARFGDLAAVLHSGLTPSQRLSQWRVIRSGQARFVVGARSAVFAPVRNLGLVVIDEEHEGSYKSGSTPRYHARQVAMYRCSRAGARLVMGSATPSVEAWHQMTVGGFDRYELTERLSGGSMPTIDVVDMRGEQGSISRSLTAAIRETLEEERQVILFLNRRGFAYFFHCRTCGYEMRCNRCSVSLTYHKFHGRMVCHYCGFSRKPVDVCPECGSLDVGYSGFGTERIEEEVRTLFPNVAVSRVDTDAVRRKGSLERILNEFRNGEIRILLGTQMVAKGLNFPGVKLVGVVMADTGLHLPDFRAWERSFALLVQVSGRAGRFTPDGRVIVQTYSPDNPAIASAARNEIDHFYSREISIRRGLRFPPFARLFRLVFRSKDRSKALAVAVEYAAALSGRLPAGDMAMGPAECPLFVISGNSRYQLIVKSGSFNRAHAALREAVASIKKRSGVYVEIDVDPVDLL